MLSNKEVEKIVKVNKEKFEKLLDDVKNTSNLEEKYKLAQRAVLFANNESTGYYSSDILEEVFLKIAEKYSIKKNENGYKKNTILHVMTQAFETGGHTRVVENWIELSEECQEHSLVLTKDHSIPKKLKSIVEKKQGKVIVFSDQMTDIEKGLTLREVAEEFEFIVLHVHMHDSVPLIAFGTKEFSRPVIFFNHADHRFWLGISISDVVAELRSWGQMLSRTRRGCKNSTILGIPNDKFAVNNSNKKEIREKLNLPIDKKIILTIGSPHKYKSLESSDFFKLIKEILRKNENFFLIAIGPTYKDFPEWKKLPLKMKKRVMLLGIKSPSELLDYIEASDVGIDSFPMSGGIALSEIVLNSRPAIAVKCPTGHFDYLLNTWGYCENEEQAVEKLNTVLTNTQRANELLVEQQDALRNYNNDEWKAKLKKIYALTNNKHKIVKFTTPPIQEFDELDIYLVSSKIKYRQYFRIPYCCSFFRMDIDGKKQYRFHWEMIGSEKYK